MEYLARLPFTMGVTLLQRDATIQGSSFYNGLMFMDQITFQMEYAWNGAGSTKESVILEYLSKLTNSKATYQYVEQYMGIWKELVSAGLAGILRYRNEYLNSVVFTRIKLARIFVIMKNPNDELKLTLLHKLESFFLCETETEIKML